MRFEFTNACEGNQSSKYLAKASVYLTSSHNAIFTTLFSFTTCVAEIITLSEKRIMDTTTEAY